MASSAQVINYAFYEKNANLSSKELSSKHHVSEAQDRISWPNRDSLREGTGTVLSIYLGKYHAAMSDIIINFWPAMYNLSYAIVCYIFQISAHYFTSLCKI